MALVMATAFVTAPFCKWNRVAGLLMCYVSNPLTGLPIFWACYKTGTCFVGGDVTFAHLRELVTPTAERPFWDQFKELCVDLSWPMLIGTLIVCTVSALLTYPFVFWLVSAYQRRGGAGGTSLEPTANLTSSAAAEPAPASIPLPRIETAAPAEDRCEAVISA